MLIDALTKIHQSKDEDTLNSALGMIVDMSDTEPKFMLKHFPLIVETCCKIASDPITTDLNQSMQAIEILVNVIERVIDTFDH